MRKHDRVKRAQSAGAVVRQTARTLSGLFAVGRIRTRLFLGFGFVSALLVVVAVVGLVTTSSLARTADEVVTQRFPMTVVLSEAQASILTFGNYADLAVMNAKEGNAGRIPNHVKRMDVSAAEVDAALKALIEGDAELGITPDEEPECVVLLGQISASWGELRSATYGKVKRDLDAGGFIVNIQTGMTEGASMQVQGVTDLQNVEIKREKVTQQMQALQAIFEEEVVGAVQQVEGTRRLASTASVAAMLIGLFVAAAIALGVASSITTPLMTAVAYATAVARGDLTASLDHHTKDEIGDLTTTVEAMKESLVQRMDQLREVAREVTGVADRFAKDSEAISAAAQRLNEGAEGQSSAAEETSASIEQLAVSIDEVAANADSLGTSASETAATMGQMSVSIEQIAHNMSALSDAVSETSSSVEEMIASIEQVAGLSNDVAESSQTALKAAGEGAVAVDAMADTVADISKATEIASDVMKGLAARLSEIGVITAAIDDIADQTNMLALNAAIEAARAGEHGRGFAVVAEAVRDLAGQAAASTREIASLVDSITADSDRAVQATLVVLEQASGSGRLAEAAQGALGNVRSTFEEVAGSMGQVKSATAEQAQGGRQVISAVEQMSLLHRQVDEAMREQAIGSRRVVEAAEDMSGRVQQVATAMSEQKRGGEQMVSAMESISHTTRGNLEAISDLAGAAARLAAQSDDLRRLAQGFALEEESPASVEPEAADPGATVEFAPAVEEMAV